MERGEQWKGGGDRSEREFGLKMDGAFSQKRLNLPEISCFRSEEGEFIFSSSPTTVTGSNSRIRRTLGKIEISYREKIKLLFCISEL